MFNTKMIGNKIAEARKKINISQAQLAGLLFISPQAVGKWERGESMPDITTFSRLAEILGVDLNYFSETIPSGSAEMTPGESTDQQPAQEAANLPGTPERQVLTDFSASNLLKSDFAGVTAHNGKFEASMLRGSDFSGADLAGSLFKACDARESNFDGTNLTDCNLSVIELEDASFNNSILVRTNFSMAGLAGAKFTGIKLTDVRMNMTDLRKTVFEDCIFDGVDFKNCDLRDLCLDGQTFLGVRFDESSLDGATFRGATLKNVAFLASVTWHTWSKKFYRAIKTISFDDAKMDKLTYAALKGLGAGLSKVTII